MLMAFRPGARLLAACAFAAATGYVDLGDTYDPEGGAFKIGNAAVFLPVFVLGQLFPLEFVLERLPWRWGYFAVGSVLLAMLCFAEGSKAGQKFMLGIPNNGGWSDVQFSSAAGAGLYWTREILFYNIYAIVKMLLFLVLVCPRSAGIMSELGQYSIYPYLLHLQFVPLATWLLSLCGLTLTSSALLELATSFVICTLLATWPVRSVFWVFFQPTWLEGLLADAAPAKPKLPEAKLVQIVEDTSANKPTLGQTEPTLETRDFPPGGTK